MGPQARFPQTLTDGQTIYTVYQASERSGDEGGVVHISVARSERGIQWELLDRRIGPIPYGGTSEPFLFWSTINAAGEIFVAVTQSADRTVVYRSVDRGNSFQIVHTIETDRTNVAPRIYAGAGNAVTLFLSQNVDGRQAIVYLRSDDGVQWSAPQVLETDAQIGLTFLPSYAARDGVEVVVYQGLNIVRRTTYQLYRRMSTDGGRTWSPAERLTTFVDPTQTDNADLYDNQRPFIVPRPDANGFYLAWERRYQTGSPQIYLMELDAEGRSAGIVEEVTGRLELARAPALVFLGKTPVITYFTNPQGNSRVLLSTRGRFRWESRALSPAVGEAVFASPAVHRDRLHITWQTRSGPTGSNVVYLEPDQRVALPTIQPLNFRLGERSNASRAQFQIVDPPDASGVRGYAFSWSRDPEAPVPTEVQQFVPNRQIAQVADDDGPWYLRVRAADFAGNWSEPATIRFFRDQTPPGPVAFPRPSVDENGLMVANSFEVGWIPPPDEDVAGYSVRLDYVGPELTGPVQPRPVSGQIVTAAPQISRTNVEDGLWVLTVAAVDTVGNVGPASALPLRFNKFVASTQAFAVVVDRDPVGRYQLRINGRGFLSDGEVTRILVDRTGTAPYDFEFLSRRNDFAVPDDRTIGNIVIDEIPTGTYRLLIEHSERGLYLAPQALRFEARGVVKFGDFSPVYVSRLHAVPIVGRFTTLGTFTLLAALGALLLAVLSLWRLAVVGREIRTFELHARMLIDRAPILDSKEKERAKHMRKAGIGLRIKFAFFVVLLVMSVVLLLAVVLSRNVLERQERLLVQGLRNRVELLVEGMVSGARPALQNPRQNIDQLQTLVGQGEALEEAQYVTLTGLNAAADVIETIYATTDGMITRLMGVAADVAGAAGETETDATTETAQEMQRRIDTETYIVGLSRLEDALTPLLEDLSRQINLEARGALGLIPQQLDELSQQAQALILRGAGEAEIIRIDQARTELLRTAAARLTAIAGEVQSFPPYDPQRLSRDQREFVFFKPVLDLIPGAGADFSAYYRGTVRVAISTQSLLDELAATTRDLITTTILVAVAALVFGIIGAYILATIVVIPIDRLVKLVAQISATEDKAELKGLTIQLKSRDELSVLANTINEMTAGLVKAAEANRDLMFGKETQKMFIPLSKVSDDRKRTTGEVRLQSAEFYGYYEGAKGVSGDYFSYQKLDERFFAFIKCDVAGKGVPAALIMVQVATVFLDHFREWTLKKPGLNVSTLVTRMNDLVAEREFKGRFAALTTGIFDTQTGALHLTNAGDNQIHIFRAAQGEVVQTSLARTPAAGVFTSDFIPSGFPQERYDLASGDMLLLFTDGLEEAKRYYRDADYNVYTLTEDDVSSGRVPEEALPGSDNEELSTARIHAVIKAVNARGSYALEKVLDPAAEPLLFDFSAISDPLRDSVLAIMSMEKLFRVYRDPKAGPNTRISVDRTIDEFLQKHFVQYRSYFHTRIERDDALKGEYVTFAGLSEDEQYDDLTLLALRKL